LATCAPGLTLIEILIAVFLLVLILTPIFVSLNNAFRFYRTGSIRADVQAAVRTGMDGVARELSDALEVALNPADTSLIVFWPARRGEEGQVLFPPRPDPDKAVRYWLALQDPTRPYRRYSHLPGANSFFLARTEVPEPLKRDDAWNSTGDPRATAVFTVDGDSGTKQPLYPVAEAQARGSLRYYLDHVVAITPQAEEFDVHGSFTPTLIPKEMLRRQSTRSGAGAVYRSLYPLWSRDPLILVYRSLDGERELAYGAAYNHATRSVCIWEASVFATLVSSGGPINDATGYLYDTKWYGDETLPVWGRVRMLPGGGYQLLPYGFGIDFTQGALRFDFPPPGVPGRAIAPGDPEVVPFGDAWFDSSNRYVLGASFVHTAGRPPVRILPDTVSVWAELQESGDQLQKRTLKRVEREPRPGEDEYRLIAPTDGDPNYNVELPPTRSGDPAGSSRLAPSAYGAGDSGLLLRGKARLFISYRWRDNADSDVIIADYSTRAIIKVALTVTKMDPAAREPGRTFQTASLTRLVKLRNLVE
jgi:hypothetical protein